MKHLGFVAPWLLFLACGAFGFTYQVKKGDVLSRIAQKYHVTLKQIIELNPQISNPNLIYPNQIVTLIEEHPVVATVPQERTPQSEPTPTPLPPLPQKKPHSIFSVTPRFSYSRIDATDSANGGSATLLSYLNTGLTLGWMQVWSDQWQTYLNANLTSTNWEHFPGQTLNPSTQTLSGFEMGGRDQVSERTALKGAFGFQQKIFVNAANVTLLNLSSVPIPYLNAQVDYDFFKREQLRLGGSLGASAFLSAVTNNYTINPGQAFYGKIYLAHQLGTMEFLGDLGYGRDNQGTSLASQALTDLSFGFGLKWHVGGSP